MTSGQIDAGTMEGSYGFGLFVRDLLGHRQVSHGGGINGFNSMLMYFPDDDLHIAVISNSSGFSSSDVAYDLARDFLGLPEPEPEVSEED